jgi:thiosulfate reductase cytochrome b subunit
MADLWAADVTRARGVRSREAGVRSEAVDQTGPIETLRPLAGAVKPRSRLIYRHSVVVRITHWLNLLCLTILLMSGLQIFNAHPALYWGKFSDFAHPFFSITARQAPGGAAQGITQLYGHSLDTTGVLGVSRDASGRLLARGFPPWATLPSWQSLADGRLWHFFFAWLLVFNGAIYVLYGLANRHLWRDLVPSRRDLGRIGHVAWEHVRLRFPKGEEARHYNVLQKGSYLLIVAVVLPVIVLAGLTMSPRLDAGFPWLLAIFGGRQSARSVHFICAFLLLGFTVVHLFMVLVSGVWNNLRSMLTGRYAIRVEEQPGE